MEVRTELEDKISEEVRILRAELSTVDIEAKRRDEEIRTQIVNINIESHHGDKEPMPGDVVDIGELEERDFRKMNIVAFNIPESKSADPEERK